jgi:Domain of unknown function (DUF4328)
VVAVTPHLRDLVAPTILAGVSALGLTAAVVANAVIAGRAVEAAGSAPEGEATDHWSISAFDSIQSVAVIVLAAAWVTTSAWLYRARRNSELIDPSTKHARARVWTWLGWVAPVVFLWFPFQLVRDVRRASDPRPPPRALLGVWWALWLAALLTSRFGFVISRDAVDDDGSIPQVTIITWLAAALMVLALVQWALVMRSVVLPQREALRLSRLIP